MATPSDLARTLSLAHSALMKEEPGSIRRPSASARAAPSVRPSASRAADWRERARAQFGANPTATNASLSAPRALPRERRAAERLEWSTAASGGGGRPPRAEVLLLLAPGVIEEAGEFCSSISMARLHSNSARAWSPDLKAVEPSSRRPSTELSSFSPLSRAPPPRAAAVSASTASTGEAFQSCGSPWASWPPSAPVKSVGTPLPAILDVTPCSVLPTCFPSPVDSVSSTSRRIRESASWVAPAEPSVSMRRNDSAIEMGWSCSIRFGRTRNVVGTTPIPDWLRLGSVTSAATWPKGLSRRAARATRSASDSADAPSAPNLVPPPGIRKGIAIALAATSFRTAALAAAASSARRSRVPPSLGATATPEAPCTMSRSASPPVRKPGRIAGQMPLPASQAALAARSAAKRSARSARTSSAAARLRRASTA
mmetsp:Transcript_3873/g.11964  ORF Transcript_3873/g.11964 Transcript_3873/m.11964 type:complete len:428 (-) Transcript_3873:436-1719(-)